MLPPPRSPKREMNVSIRFSEPHYQRLKQIADYRQMTVTALLHYVTVNSVLPKLEREMHNEQRQVPLEIEEKADLPTDLSWLDTLESKAKSTLEK